MPIDQNAIPTEVQKAYEKALKARERAHAPYSHFKVGACLKLKGKDEYIVGVNVENVSYGATVCAERNAFGAMISQWGLKEADFIVVVTDSEPAAQPCALCLQVMAEFCPPEFPVYMGNLSGLQGKRTFAELLPNPFQHFVGKD